MKNLKAHRAALPLAAALAACPSFAQFGQPLSPMVVTATRSELPLTDVLADVSLVDRDVIERSGATSVADVLARLPGITISQTGGPVSITGVFIRGAESRFTAVFIDGARVDSQSTGGTSWETIPLAQVDRIEVLRGPAAAIYGSDAVAGVVHIFTRQGEPGFFPSVRIGVGSYKTHDLSASLRGASGNFDYAASLAADRSAGFNAQPTANPDRDGYRNRSLSTRLGWKIQPGQKLELTMLDNEQESDYDGFSSSVRDLATRNLQTIGLNWTSQWSDAWNTRASVSRGTERYETAPSAYKTETRISTLLLRNELRAAGGLLTADFERREDALENASTTPESTRRHQDALALGYGVRFGNNSLQLNARHDKDSEFGRRTTGAAAYGYAITPELRVTASVATAFRAPTLFQRFSIYGIPELKAETSLNRELGLRWQSGVHHASVATYRNDVENLINYVSGPGNCANGSGMFAGCYGNVGRARMTGTTLTGGTQINQVSLGASVDWMDPRNVITDKLLPRRARKQALLSADLPLGEWRIGGELQYVGERFNNASNSTRLAPYNVLNATVSKSIGQDWSVLARVNNVADKDYTLAQGFATPGRNVYVGLTWAPRR